MHWTPKHCSWLNRAEVERGLLRRARMYHGIGPAGAFTDEVEAYLALKSKESTSITSKFTNQNARIKLKSLYATI